MKNRKRVGGLIRLIILAIVLVAAAAVIRMAVGRIASVRAEKEAAEQTSSIVVDSAAGYTAQEYAADPSLVSEEETTQKNVFSVLSELGENAADRLSSDTGATTAAASEDEEDLVDRHLVTELEKGQAYLASLEERTPAEMEYMIAEAQKEHEKEVKREEYNKKRQQYIESLEGSKLWEAFDEYVFLGDSRVVGYEVFGFLPSERVLAESGDTINAIDDNMDTVRSLSPKYIFISYGINDIGIGFWPTAEEYASAFAEKLHSLQKELPDAQIYVNSIIPARDDAAQLYPVWQGLPEYSEAVRQMCEKEAIPFIDNGSIIQEHSDLYATDGVHMQSDFYRYWAENQLLGIYDHENGLLTF